MPVPEKRCRCCQRVKPAHLFIQSSRNKDGLYTYCKVCDKSRRELLPFIKGPTRDLRSVEERLWSHIDKVADPFSCWLWTASTTTHGYGNIGVDGVVKLTHILVYEIAYGPFLDGLFVCHACDNPPCCRPSHLFLGTQIDNMRDCARKGRTSTPISVEDVYLIRSFQGVLTLTETARLLKRPISSVYNIWKRNTRKFLPDIPIAPTQLRI